MVINFECEYGYKSDVTPETIDSTRRKCTENFVINFDFVLAMQLLGKGLQTMTTFLGLFGLQIAQGNYDVWKRIQDKVGESQQLLAKQCCEENLQKEVEATKASGILPLVDGRVPITCSGDMGWQGSALHCIYNSQSGQTMLCGGITKKVVAFRCFSKLCHTCKDHEKKDPEKILPPPIHQCPQNWKESSKSMEPDGTVECAKQVWNSCIVCMETFCSDDDSSSQAMLRHPIQMQIKKGYINEWPVDAKNGRHIKSTGRLPAEIHKILTYLVDPSHCHCIYGGQLCKSELKLRVLKKQSWHHSSGCNVI